MIDFTIKKVQVNAEGEIVEKKTSPKLPADIPKKSSTGIRTVKVSLSPITRTKRKDYSGNGHWEFEEALGQNGEFGFIYLIHDILNDRMYIGKKQFLGTGKKNKGVSTNWQWYTSSCKELCESIKANGKEHFKFYVLEQYRIRGSLGFAETWSICHVEALANRDKWYNGLINKVSWTVKESITERHKERLKAILCNETMQIWEPSNILVTL